MPSSNDRLPLYAADGELLYCVTVPAAKRLLETGRAIGRGTRNRVRSLVAMSGTEELLRAERVPAGHPFSHRHETPRNPRGVWTHDLRRCLAYG